MSDIFCQGFSRPLRLADCEQILPSLKAFMGRWPMDVVPSDDTNEAVITLTGRDDGLYVLKTPWLAEELETESPTKVLCNLAVDLVSAWLEESSGVFGLHGAAVEFSGRLVVFPNTNHAGKSLLTAALMAKGFTAYSDDLLAVTPAGRGRSFGFPPRLRLPWPDLAEKLGQYLETHLAFPDRHYCFVKTEGPELASFGQERPIGAVVVLDRKAEKCPAELIPVTSEAGLKALVNRYLLRPGQARKALLVSQKMLRGLPVWRLRYDSLEEATTILMEAFGPTPAWGFQNHDRRPPLPKPGAEPPHLAPSPKSTYKTKHLARRRYACRRNVLLVAEGEAAFLVSPDGDRIFHLNQIGSLVWRMMGEPLSQVEAASLLLEVFPGQHPDRIAEDIRIIFEDLIENGLIVRSN